MNSPTLDTAIDQFKRRQRTARYVILIALVAVLAATTSILVYFSYQSWQSEIRAEAQKRQLEAQKRQLEAKTHQLEQLAAEAHMRSDIRTERPLNRIETLKRINGDLQRRSEEHTSELQSLRHLVCRLLL